MNRKTKTEDDGFVLLRADQITPKKITWLWKQRIALAKLSLIEGDPGTGKSLVTDDIASRISTGQPFPDQPDVLRPPGGVILLSGEDDPDDTVVPRLMAHGADLSKIGILRPVYRADGQTKVINIGNDIERLSRKIDEVEGCQLVVVDPISAFLGKTDSYKDSEVRAVLTPLADLAREKRVAIVVVMHLNKKVETKAMYRGNASIAFSAAARSIWLVCRRKDYHTRLLVPIKTNIGPDDIGGLEFKININSDEQPVINWSSNPIMLTAEDALAEQSSKPSSEPERDRAKNWLTMLLRNGRKQCKQVLSEAKKVGIAEMTLRRAKDELGVRSYRNKKTGIVYWELPKKVRDTAA